MADDSVRVIWSGNDDDGTRIAQVRLSRAAGAKHSTLSIQGVSGGVVIPDEASGISVDSVKLYGSPPDGGVGWVHTRGELRVRAMVRYFWPMDGNEVISDAGETPTLEIFVNEAYLAHLPRIEGWTVGWVDEFKVVNEDYVLTQLFDPKTLRYVRSKRLLRVEVDAELLLKAIHFGSECGLRYRATAVNAKRWRDSGVLVKIKGLDAHC